MRLLEQVTPQAGVGLLAVPRTLVTQNPNQFVEASKLVGDGLGHLGEIQRGEMVGLEFAVEISPGDFDDALVGQPESLQDDRRGRRLLEGELDIGEHMVGVGVGHEERAGLSGCGGREHMAVDQPDPDLDRVDLQATPHGVEKGHRRKDLELEIHVGRCLPHQLHRSFEYERRTRYGIDEVVDSGERKEIACDLLINVGEPIGGLVDVVVGRRVDDGGCGMPGCAQPHRRGRSEPLRDLRGDQLGASRTEPHDGESTRHVRAQPSIAPGGAMKRTVESHTPSRSSSECPAATRSHAASTISVPRSLAMRSRASGSKLPSACWIWASVISGWFSGVSSPIVRTEMTCQPNWERTGDEMLPLPASRAPSLNSET